MFEATTYDVTALGRAVKMPLTSELKVEHPPAMTLKALKVVVLIVVEAAVCGALTVYVPATPVVPVS